MVARHIARGLSDSVGFSNPLCIFTRVRLEPGAAGFGARVWEDQDAQYHLACGALHDLSQGVGRGLDSGQSVDKIRE